MAEDDAKQKLKDAITDNLTAPDVKDKVVKFADLRGQFTKAARKEFGALVTFVIDRKMNAMEKKIAAEEGGVPETVPVSKFMEKLLGAVESGEVPSIGYDVMTKKVTPMLAEAVRAASAAVAADPAVAQESPRPATPVPSAPKRNG
ncbi:MAG: hypothetical protein ACAH80_15355 [Alphaproteobacteria bacterium]